MSTRAVYTFTDNDDTIHVYKHYDGYPEGDCGGLAALQAAVPYAWPMPRFEASDFAAAFVAANKSHGGGDVRLANETDPHAVACDAAYHYVVTASKGQVHVKCYEVDWWDQPQRKLVKTTSLSRHCD